MPPLARCSPCRVFAPSRIRLQFDCFLLKRILSHHHTVAIVLSQSLPPPSRSRVAGFARVSAFDATLGQEQLLLVPASQASAQQRAGRAGRTAPGKCLRLFTEHAFRSEMLPAPVPEIQVAAHVPCRSVLGGAACSIAFSKFEVHTRLGTEV